MSFAPHDRLPHTRVTFEKLRSHGGALHFVLRVHDVENCTMRTMSLWDQSLFSTVSCAVPCHRAQVYDTFDYVVGRAVCSIPKFIQLVEKNLRRNDGTGGGSRRAPERLKKGVLYMRGAATLEELAELGAQPTAIVPLDTLSREEGNANAEEWGYSSVFHFVSEDIFRRYATEVWE